jgi:predicted ABC-type ATPase
LLAGAPGAGKTTFYEAKLKTVFPSLVRASSSPLESSAANQERLHLLGNQASFVYQDVVIDTKIMREARKAGFGVKIIYLATESPNLNIGRILLRVGQGGPFAPLARVAELHTRGICQLSEARRLADDVLLFDNTPNGRGPRLIAHFREGKLDRLARSLPAWTRKAFGKELDKGVNAQRR